MLLTTAYQEGSYTVIYNGLPAKLPSISHTIGNCTARAAASYFSLRGFIHPYIMVSSPSISHTPYSPEDQTLTEDFILLDLVHQAVSSIIASCRAQALCHLRNRARWNDEQQSGSVETSINVL
ncbi:hypothetical protein AAC387_Pa09g0199 [Persea americana]